MIELFWLMLFVGISYFEGIQLSINIDWEPLFSFHLIDETGWFKELMKRMGKDMKSDLSVFHSTHLCAVWSVWWNGYFNHCVSVSNRFTWIRAPPWPHVWEWWKITLFCVSQKISLQKYLHSIRFVLLYDFL